MSAPLIINRLNIAMSPSLAADHKAKVIEGKFFTVKDFLGIIFGHDQVGNSSLRIFSGL